MSGRAGQSGNVADQVFSFSASAELSETLQWASMQVISNANCALAHDPGMVTGNVVCGSGWSVDTPGACLGDSGGPMIYYEALDFPVILGVISTISDGNCGSGVPTRFARVTQFLTWINSITGIPLRN